MALGRGLNALIPETGSKSVKEKEKKSMGALNRNNTGGTK